MIKNTQGILTAPAGAYENWENGFLAGNGRVGIIDLCNPQDNYIIFCHRRFFMARDTLRSFATVDSETIEAIRNACVNEDWKTANDLANSSNGWKDGGEGQKHPGFSLSSFLKTNGEIRDYQRRLDYSTGEITVTFGDSNNSYTKRLFVSRTDSVVMQQLSATDGDISISFTAEIRDEMHFPEKMYDNSFADENGVGITVKYSGSKRNIGYEGYARVEQIGGTRRIEGNTLHIEHAKSITVYAYTDKYYGDCDSIFESNALKNRMLEIKEDYNALFLRHSAKHSEIFNRVSLDLCGNQSSLTNSQLIEAQKSSNLPLSDVYERLFYAGRYHFISCCDEKGAPDLLGLWTGDCNVGWDGFYHLDANFNLQCSGGITGNLLDMMEGYFYLFDCWADGFRETARKLLGCRGMVGGGNNPGESSGLISGIDSYFYPYHYVTGEISWLLYPFYEYYAATGDKEFLKKRLYPYLLEMSDFYDDFLKVKDKDGKYLFAGSISPENQPKDVKFSLVNNSLFDIEGARFIFKTLIEAGNVLGEDKEKIAYWQEQLSLLPDYLIDEEGALGEWAYKGLANHHYHRHCSGLMGVWPYRYITPENKKVFDAAATALSEKDKFVYQGAGHGLLHAALIAAGVNDTASLTKKLLEFVQTDFFFPTLASAHYADHRVFCTDVCHTLPNVIMQSIIASDTDGIELLPACPFECGEISGLLTKCRCKIEKFTWNKDKLELTVSSNTDNRIRIYSRNLGKEVYVDLKKDVPKKVIL